MEIGGSHLVIGKSQCDLGVAGCSNEQKFGRRAWKEQRVT